MFKSLESLFNGGINRIELCESFDFSREGGEGFEFLSPVSVNGAIVNRSGIVELKAACCFDFRARCDRCACDFTRSVSLELFHTLITDDEMQDIADDCIVVEGMQLDLFRLVFEDIYLSMPSKLLCRPDCKGLCQGCAANLNFEPCTCKKEIDPRWAALLDGQDS